MTWLRLAAEKEEMQEEQEFVLLELGRGCLVPVLLLQADKLKLNFRQACYCCSQPPFFFCPKELPIQSTVFKGQLQETLEKGFLFLGFVFFFF